ncbi:hypothetical protein V6N12_073011 [Hibiscus sabdariffa]|uniref:Uncharacterized protein n=1 Tax=Hibiscus sabdariffa TaxID=183260 RepID=A0ABR2B063_9ROSI
MEQHIKARLGAVLKQFQVDDIQNLPRQQLWHLPGQSWASNRSPAENPTEAGLYKKYKVECDWISIFF